jgi:hypothetical protein
LVADLAALFTGKGFTDENFTLLDASMFAEVVAKLCTNSLLINDASVT